jgi:predicted transcriptional regulator
MKLPARIKELLTATPGMTSAQIASVTGAKVNTVKVTLNKMNKSNRVTREKIHLADKTGVGPRKVYAYRLVEVKLDQPTGG